MSAALTAMTKAARADNRAAFIDADEAFHLAIIEGSGNQLLASLWRNIRNLIAVFGARAILAEERMDEAIAEHRAVLDALRSHKSKDALAALERHLAATEQRLLDSFGDTAER
jgi:GntR family transcriptional regulator, transcriptional repressor for pyruvate dehydrogenase complex